MPEITQDIIKALYNKKIFYLNNASDDITEIKIIGIKWGGYNLSRLNFVTESGAFYSLLNGSTTFLTKQEAETQRDLNKKQKK